MLNPIHLQTLHVVLRTGSFARAGKELGYTGSAVSQQIASLERQIGADLFERDARSVTPTPTARYLAERSTEVLAALRELDDDLAAHRHGEVGRLRIGAFPTASERLLPGALSYFHRTRPNVEVKVVEEQQHDLVEMVASRELDIALSYRYGNMRYQWRHALHTEALLREDLFLLTPVGHRLVSAPEVETLAPFERETWILPDDRSQDAMNVARVCEHFGFTPNITYQSESHTTIHALVAAGLGVAVLPALACRPFAGVTHTRIDAPVARRMIHAVRSPALADGPWVAMLDALRSAAQHLMATAPGVHPPGAVTQE